MSDNNLTSASADASTPFTVPMHARWADIDQNGHMRTVAYLEWAEDSRMRFFASAGFAMSEFQRFGIGPAIRSDELTYRAEMRLLEQGTIEVWMAGISDDGARFKMRNIIRRADGDVAVTVDSLGGWIDLRRRSLTTPPAALSSILTRLARTDDFDVLRSLN